MAIKMVFSVNPARLKHAVYQVYDMEVMCSTKTLVLISTSTHLPIHIAAILFSIFPKLSAWIIQYQ